MKKILLFLLFCAALGEVAAQLPVEIPTVQNLKIFPDYGTIFHEDANWYYVKEDRRYYSERIVKYPKSNSGKYYTEDDRVIVFEIPNKNFSSNFRTSFLNFRHNDQVIIGDEMYFFAYTGVGNYGIEIARLNLKTHEYHDDFISLSGSDLNAAWKGMYLFNGRIYALAEMRRNTSSIALNALDENIIVQNDSPSNNRKVQAALISFSVGNMRDVRLEHHFKDPNYVDHYYVAYDNLFNRGGEDVVIKFHKQSYDPRIESFFVHFNLNSASILSSKDVIGNVAFLYASNGEFVFTEKYARVPDEHGNFSIQTVHRVSRTNTNWDVISVEKGLYGHAYGGDGDNHIIFIKETTNPISKYFFAEGALSSGSVFSFRLPTTYNYFFSTDKLRRTFAYSELEPDNNSSIDPDFEMKNIWNWSENGFSVSYQIEGFSGTKFKDPTYTGGFENGELVKLGGQSVLSPDHGNYCTSPFGAPEYANRRTVFGYYAFADMSNKIINLEISANETLHMNSKILADGTVVRGDALEIVLESPQNFVVDDNIPFHYFEGTQSSGWGVIYGQNYQYPWVSGHPNDFDYANVREENGIKFVDVCLTNYPESAEFRSALSGASASNRKTYRIYLKQVEDTTDTDGDGIFDSADNCPNTPNTDQADTDDDGIGDVCDTEECDGLDNDGDGEIDEGLLATYYRDVDGDGFGDPNDSLEACSQPTGYVTDNTDSCPNIAGPINGCIDSDNDGVADINDHCPNTRKDESVDANGCSWYQLDDDNDGVLNFDDMCNSSPSGSSVNTTGCAAVPSNIFNISVNTETCPDANDAFIVVSNRSAYRFTIAVSGDNGYSQIFDAALAPNASFTISNLTPATYTLNFIFSDTGVGQDINGFVASISAVQSAQGSRQSLDTSSRTAHYSISGDKKYNIYVDDVFQRSEEFLDEGVHEIVVSNLPNGNVSVKIVADNACRGSIEDWIHIPNTDISYYPNPVVEGVYIKGIPSAEIAIHILNVQGALVYSKKHSVHQNMVFVDLSALTEGLYIINSVQEAGDTIHFKIVKK
ncbi:MAG: thrombospondin type 3 repeat-containing protein [Flavobacteriaceae bacterium]|nr:thrombospondin type 3 repeat-containing protein [Flavobacteriaceae bacterium]